MQRASLPRPGRPPLGPDAPIERLELVAVERSLAACGWSARVEPHRAAATTATIAGGECVSLVGDRRAAVALLWCIAGLTPPSAGLLRWVGTDAAARPAPRRAFVGAGWRGYDSWTVRDALESAAPRGILQADADRRIRLAASMLRLRTADPLARLSAPQRWLVGIAAGVVAGARWLLVDCPATAECDPVVRRAVERLLATGATVVAVTHDAASILPGSRRLAVAPAALPPRDAGVPRRVAELADPASPPVRAAPASPERSVDLAPGAP